MNAGPIQQTPTGSRITLSNPTSGQWDHFIEQNAIVAGAVAYMNHLIRASKLKGPAQRLMMAKAPSKPRMAEKNAATGQRLLLCGAGPSLRDHWREWFNRANGPQKWQVWACNSALTWLREQGADHPQFYGFAIDQTEGLLTEWASVPPVKYLLASSVNPKLVALLAGRPITWFHNFVGSPGEARLYRTIWPTSVMVGDGLNSVNRALCLAKFLNFKAVAVLGADCALGENLEMHANGDGPLAHGATSVIMETTRPINGRTWATKPDMLFSAVALAKYVLADGRVTLVGDTLPNALLADAPARGLLAALDDVASLETLRGVPHPGGIGSRDAPKGRNMVSKMFTIPPANG